MALQIPSIVYEHRHFYLRRGQLLSDILKGQMQKRETKTGQTK